MLGGLFEDLDLGAQVRLGAHKVSHLDPGEALDDHVELVARHLDALEDLDHGAHLVQFIGVRIFVFGFTLCENAEVFAGLEALDALQGTLNGPQ